jgi:hypothetical protein
MIRFIVSCCAVLLCGTMALAEPPTPIKLMLTPAKPPTPALRYQLLPDSRLIISGDAAPIYRQIVELLGGKLMTPKGLLFDSWTKLPLDKLPKETVRKELAEFDEVFALLDKAARCDHCEWGLLERLREKGIAALLPEVQPMRQCAMLLSVRVRLEMAEGHFDKAVVTLRNGMALARHTGDADTLISFLVGAAIAGIMNGQLDDFVAQPGAPNLYYALTDLPAPLISMRKGLEGERVSAYGTFPGLAAVGADLNSGNLTEKQLTDCAKMIGGLEDKKLNVVERLALGTLILQRHEAAKKALIDAGRPKEKVEAMPHLQVALLHAMLEYDAALDNMIVWNNLPYWEQAQRIGTLKNKRIEDRLKDPNVPAIPLAPLLIPAVQKVTFARARTDRKIALLRIIEAIRFHAATHEGKLPPTLADIKEVPIPLDPVTGKRFDYQLDGDTAKLTAPTPAKETPNSSNSVVYELRIRKGKD